MFWVTIPYLKCVFCKYFFLVCCLLSNSLDIVVYRRFYFSFVLNTVSSLLLVYTRKVIGFSVCSAFYCCQDGMATPSFLYAEPGIRSLKYFSFLSRQNGMRMKMYYRLDNPLAWKGQPGYCRINWKQALWCLFYEALVLSRGPTRMYSSKPNYLLKAHVQIPSH